MKKWDNSDNFNKKQTITVNLIVRLQIMLMMRFLIYSITFFKFGTKFTTYNRDYVRTKKKKYAKLLTIMLCFVFVI